MYMIVHILRADIFVVIPERWIYDIEKKNEIFLNRGMNSNQCHVCFWTDNANARDAQGAILLNFEPNFRASFNVHFPMEGCYLCKIIKAKGKLP